jgi:homoprotocatechuate degradation regulator HpaR
MCLFRPALRGRGVTEQQWRILRALAHTGPMEVTELADATFLLGPSLSRILPDMEKRQLVSRKQVDSDLRRSVVSLEPKGLRLIALHAPDSERMYAEIARRFGEERVTQLFTLLHELQQSIEELAHESEASPPRSSRKPAARARKRREEL